ncbi:tail fiber protein [Acinetobacter phage SWH-Ab-1]|uniref:tail fiber protein n=1 Tax=Acinetobacter phage SWH-Ab-1 TaxID=2053604 RepID=UPI0018ACAF24|nr:tail fiber protein [Acinetobacter phage SWH-Ab-1]
MNILRSYTETVVTTPTDTFPISFEFDEKYDKVHVFLNKVAVEELGYVVTLANPTTLKIEPAIPSGTVRIERETDIDKMKYVFDAGALFIAQNVDSNFKQIVHSQQEVQDGFSKLRDDTLDTLEEFQEENFQELKEYVDGVFGMTNPNLFDGISDNMVITQNGDSQRVLNNRQNERINALEQKQGEVVEGKADKDYVDNELVKKADLTITDLLEVAKADKDYVDDKIDAVAGGLAASYETKAEADGAVSSGTIPAHSTVKVTNDPLSSNNGDWTWNGTALVKSDYDPLTQANQYTDNKTAEVKSDVMLDVSTVLNNALTLKATGDDHVFPVLVDESKNVLIGYDPNRDQIVAGGLQEQIFDKITDLKLGTSSTVIPVLTDSQGKVLIGYDTINDRAIAAGIDGNVTEVSGGTTFPVKKFAIKPLVTAINHMLFYGQSLSVGAQGTPVLSTSQPYLNTTFEYGPRMDQDSTKVVPLVERVGSPASDGGANRGETMCSGAANYASVLMGDDGTIPDKHIIFASTAGHGGYSIDQLEKGTEWYNFFIKHVTEAKRLNAGQDYKVQVVCWVQGENDAVSSKQTTYDVYKAKLRQLQIDAEADIKAITGQTEPVRFITYQMTYASKTWWYMAKAQLDLCAEDDKFLMATPMYMFPYAADNIHLTALGYKWCSGYFGRAYKRYVQDGVVPEYIRPISATVKGRTVAVKFQVPRLPLKWDTNWLKPTTDYGFAVKDGNTQMGIVPNSLRISGDTVFMELTTTPTGKVKVRYALDYLGAGLNIQAAASGNLCDSTKDTMNINGTEYPLFHLAPHFELEAFVNKGV